jgi:Seryl-tRNA synthetase
MLDIKMVRATPEIVRADLEKRHDTEKLAWVDTVLEQDKLKRELEGKNNELRARRNQIAKDINAWKKEGKDCAPLFAEAKALPAQIKANDELMEEASKTIKYYLMRLPNILHESVPYGKDDTENVVVKTVGEPKKPSFELKNHGELAAENGWADFERATKISGAGFYFLKGNLAMLDLALQRFALDTYHCKGIHPDYPAVHDQPQILRGSNRPCRL